MKHGVDLYISKVLSLSRLSRSFYLTFFACQHKMGQFAPFTTHPFTTSIFRYETETTVSRQRQQSTV